MKAIIIYPETKEIETSLESLAKQIAFLLLEAGYEGEEFSVEVGDVKE